MAVFPSFRALPLKATAFIFFISSFPPLQPPFSRGLKEINRSHISATSSFPQGKGPANCGLWIADSRLLIAGFSLLVPFLPILYSFNQQQGTSNWELISQSAFRPALR
jgi:hypothetical protein